MPTCLAKADGPVGFPSARMASKATHNLRSVSARFPVDSIFILILNLLTSLVDDRYAYSRYQQLPGRDAAVMPSRVQPLARPLPVAPLDAAPTLDSLGWAGRQPDWFPAVPYLPQALGAHRVKECDDHNRRCPLRGRCSKEWLVDKARMPPAAHSNRNAWE